MNFKYFNCFNVIPSWPLLFFAGNLSIILINDSSTMISVTCVFDFVDKVLSYVCKE